MKIVTVIGARPQFIKAGNISREIAKHKEIKEVIVHTGQHYDEYMSDIFFEEMKIPKPDYFLGFGDLSHGAMTGRMIEKIEEILISERPDIVLLYGDTNSTLAGAISASKLHIKIAHVEAGLRSFNMNMPEEINRIITDRVSSMLFCPTNTAVKNLKDEAFDNMDCRIIRSGDVMLDGAMFYKALSKRPEINIEDDFILATVHRAENTDDNEKLENIFEALNEISKDKQIILPLHPRTKKMIQHSKFNIQHLTLIDPVGYLEMVWMLDNCSIILTDSGGLQKEAFFFKKPCITLRDETEWTELVENGYNTLTGAKKSKILKAFEHINRDIEFKHSFYGDGKASEIIIKNILLEIEKNE